MKKVSSMAATAAVNAEFKVVALMIPLGAEHQGQDGVQEKPRWAGPRALDLDVFAAKLDCKRRSGIQEMKGIPKATKDVSGRVVFADVELNSGVLQATGEHLVREERLW